MSTATEEYASAKVLPRAADVAGVRCVTIRSFAEMAPHWAAWDRLAWDAPQNVPTLFPAWIDGFLRHRLKPGERWLCSFAYRGDRLVGVLPVVVTPHPRLGERAVALRTPYDDATTTSGDVPLAPEHAGPALRALLAEVRARIPGHLGIVMHRVRRNSPLWDAVGDGTPGYLPVAGRTYTGDYIDLTGGVDGYFARLGNLRRNLKRYRKKLDAKGEVAIAIRQATHLDEELLQEFLRLEASGWKGREGTAIANNAGEVAFYTTLFRHFAGQGRLEWHTLTVDGQLVAAGMGLRCRESLMLPRIAFDEAFSDYTPGSLLTEAVTKDAFARPHLREINHMSDAAWHRNWHMDEAVYQDLHLVRVGVLPALLRLPSTLVELAKVSARRRASPAVKTRYRELRSRWRRVWAFRRG